MILIITIIREDENTTIRELNQNKNQNNIVISFLCIVLYCVIIVSASSVSLYLITESNPHPSPTGLLIVSALSDDKAEDVKTDSGLMLERGRERERERGGWRERRKGTE